MNIPNRFLGFCDTLNSLWKKPGSLIVTFSLLGFSLPSLATSWVDFSQSTNLQPITSTNFNNATVLNRVIATCPRKGYLIATANAGFNFSPLALPGTGWIRYSIAKDSAAPFGIDPNHYRNVQAYQTANNHSMPGSMFRVDKCQKGETVVYVFLGQRVQASSANAWQPRLAVEFFNSNI